MKIPIPNTPNLTASSVLRRYAGLSLFAPLAMVSSLHAQDSAEEEEIYELSPFEVDASKDQGYRAENTLAGSRLNMSLEDVAQSVNVLTMEFLEDVGAENIDDILLYAVNGEENFGDVTSGLTNEDNVGTILNFSANGNINMRGNGASVTVDNNAGGGTIDTYNASRVEISQGPNAVLFGFGGAGGAINLSTQRASTTKDSLRLQSTIGSFNQFRNILNFNKSLIEDRLGVKVISLVEQAEGWRAGDEKDNRRNTFIVSWRPFQGTEISANYERAHVDKQFTVPQGATDVWQAWDAVWDSEEYDALYGAGTYASFWAGRGDNVANGIVNGRNSFRKVFIDNLDFEAEGLPTDVGNIIPLQNFARTRASIGGRMLSDEEVDISAFSPFGADSFQNEDIKNLKIGMTQRLLPDLYLNLEYFDSENTAYRITPTGRGLGIQADPNKIFDGVAAGAPYFDNMVNPFGPTDDGYHLYSETLVGDYKWFNNNSTYRGSLGYRLKTERWGDHRFNLAVNKKQKSYKRESESEVLDVYTAIERGVNLARYNLVGNNITHARNKVYRRHYYEAGPDGYPLDDGEISVGSFYDPVNMLVEDGDGNPFLLGTTWVPMGSGHRRATISDTEGTSFTWVSKWFNNKLTATLGLRDTEVATNVYGGLRANAQIVEDEDGNVVYNEDGSLALLDEAARDFVYIDPTTGEPGHNNMSQWFQSTLPTANKDSSARNETLGLVYKFNKSMSVVYNRSTNRSDPSIFRLVIPGVVAPSGDGFGQDIGLRFNLLDRKVSVNLNYFENRTDNAFTGGGVAENLLEPHRAVLDAFIDAQEGVEYFLENEDGAYVDEDGELLAEDAEPILDVARTNLPMAESDPRYLSQEERDSSYAIGVGNTLIDKASTGYDVRIIANPTKNWRLSFNFSDLLSSSSRGLYEEDLAWLAEQKVAVDARYQAYVAAGDTYLEDFDYALRNIEDTKNEFFILEEDSVRYHELLDAGDSDGAAALLASIHPLDRAYDYIAQETGVTKLQVEEINTGSSKKKGNMFTSYRFRQGGMKGLTLGGGFSWRDKRTLNHFFNYTDENGESFRVTRPNANLGDYDSITIYESDDDFRLNLMASYSTKMKILNRDTNVKFQVNVNNVMQDDYQFLPLRYQLDGSIKRYSIIGPRTWKIATTIDF